MVHIPVIMSLRGHTTNLAQALLAQDAYTASDNFRGQITVVRLRETTLARNRVWLIETLTISILVLYPRPLWSQGAYRLELIISNR